MSGLHHIPDVWNVTDLMIWSLEGCLTHWDKSKDSYWCFFIGITQAMALKKWSCLLFNDVNNFYWFLVFLLSLTCGSWFPLPFRSSGQKSSHQAWWQASLPAEMSHQPSVYLYAFQILHCFLCMEWGEARSVVWWPLWSHEAHPNSC